MGLISRVSSRTYRYSVHMDFKPTTPLRSTPRRSRRQSPRTARRERKNKPTLMTSIQLFENYQKDVRPGFWGTTRKTFCKVNQLPETTCTKILDSTGIQKLAARRTEMSKTIKRWEWIGTSFLIASWLICVGLFIGWLEVAATKAMIEIQPDCQQMPIIEPEVETEALARDWPWIFKSECWLAGYGLVGALIWVAAYGQEYCSKESTYEENMATILEETEELKNKYETEKQNQKETLQMLARIRKQILKFEPTRRERARRWKEANENKAARTYEFYIRKATLLRLKRERAK